MANKQRIMRVLKQEDLDAIVAIDEFASKQSRREYYERKIASILNKNANINCSLVCEVEGKVVGFVMGYVFFGEFGISDATATIDTLGVHPKLQKFGVASEMLDQFLMNMKAAGVTVFTVGFHAPANVLPTLRDCASSADYFYDAYDASALTGAFRRIADELSQLKLSR